MKIGYSLLNLPSKKYQNIETALNAVKELGFVAVELAAFENWEHISPSKLYLDEIYFENVLNDIVKSNMNIVSINSNFSFELTKQDEESYKLFKNEFIALLRLSKKIGCSKITLQPGGMTGENIYEICDLAINRYLEISAIAKEYGVVLLLESHLGSILDKIDIAKYVFDKVWPEVMLTYDHSHFEMQGINLDETSKLFKYIGNVHIRDASLDNMQCEIRKGTIDFDLLIKMLRENNYDGYIIIEYFNGFDKEFASSIKFKKFLLENGIF